VRLINWVCRNWDQPDEGIWEVRGGRQPLFYSRLMCWVAIDRGLRLAAKRSLPAVENWIKVRDEIYRQIHTEFWNEELQSFVQTKGGSTLDAASLLAPLVRFISPTDPRWLSTLKLIEQKLVDDSLVYRYRTEDGLTGSEGTFCMCSFWFIECVAKSGDIDKARFLFEKMLGYANHLGLYPEELGPSGEHLGNFPQAFTHMALISAAFQLNRKLDEKNGQCTKSVTGVVALLQILAGARSEGIANGGDRGGSIHSTGRIITVASNQAPRFPRDSGFAPCSTM
jgi:GH15 family glucan-1,4-alpha-glucosidase